jgi:hypothetical protein
MIPIMIINTNFEVFNYSGGIIKNINYEIVNTDGIRIEKFETGTIRDIVLKLIDSEIPQNEYFSEGTYPYCKKIYLKNLIEIAKKEIREETNNAPNP